METIFTQKYAGKRWQVLFGEYGGVAGFALTELQRVLQYYLPYVLTVLPAAGADPAMAEHLALVGTTETHPLIAALIAAGKMDPPPGPQGYSIACTDSPWGEGNRLIVIAGADARGVLYGVEEFNARAFNDGSLLEGRAGMRQCLDGLRAFTVREAPAVAERGIWCWRYVIYDYRRFLDHLARLKMNLLTIWNDHVPLNAREVIDYAHSRGIKVIFGFHWGWGYDGRLSLASAEDRAYITRDVLRTYRAQYAGLEHDGIYFQTLTEHRVEQMDGVSTATYAMRLVNDTAAALLDAYPGLSIQFGLHATSIGEHYADLAELDPRVIITWEDAGALPFSYAPESSDGVADTREYAKKLAAFRPGTPFGMVPKGWMYLRRETEFENHGPFLLGEHSPLAIHERLLMRQGELDRHNSDWLRLYPLAARFYRELLAINPRMLVTGLVEDGLFEEKIQPAVALLGEMLWNPHQDDAEILRRALRPYYARFSE